MSDRLRQSLMSSRSEIEAGIAEAEAELARVRQRAAELEELIALGTATLLAAEMIKGGGARSGQPEVAAEPATAPAPQAPSPEPPAAADPAPIETGPRVEPPSVAREEPRYEDDLRSLLERAQS